MCQLPHGQRNTTRRWLNHAKWANFDLVAVYFGDNAYFDCPQCKKVSMIGRMVGRCWSTGGVSHAIYLGNNRWQAPDAHHRISWPTGAHLLSQNQRTMHASATCPCPDATQVYHGKAQKFRLFYSLHQMPEWKNLTAQYKAVMTADDDLVMSTCEINRYGKRVVHERWDCATSRTTRGVRASSLLVPGALSCLTRSLREVALRPHALEQGVRDL